MDKETDDPFIKFTEGEITFDEWFATLPPEVQARYKKKKDFWSSTPEEVGFDL